MGTHTEGLLNKLPTVATCLRGETWIHSYHSMTSPCSLIFKNSEELTPCGIQDALRKVMVLYHIGDLQVLYRDMVIGLCILFGNFEMVIAALTLNLQMGLCRAASNLTAAMRAFLATTHGTLLTSQCFLRGAIKTWVLYGIALAISQERLESYINANIRMRTVRWNMLIVGLRLTDDKRVPVPIRTMNEVKRLGSALYRAVQLDLEEMPDLLGNNEVFLVFVQIAILAVLPELNRMPSVRFLEAWETNTRDSMLFGSKKAFEGFREAISKHLNGSGRHMFALPFKDCFQVILAGKCFVLLILRFDRLKHAIIQSTRLCQASRERTGLFLIRIQSKLKRSHAYILPNSIRIIKRGMYALRRRHFIPIAEARGPHAAYR